MGEPMACNRAATCNDQTGIPASRTAVSNSAAAHGFVLIYALWVIAAIATTLAVIVKMAGTSAGAGSQQLELAVKQQQMVNVMGYVVTHTVDHELVVDPRYSSYLLQKQRGEEEPDDKMVFLKELLRQMNFDLELDNASKDEAGSKEDKAKQEDKGTITRSKTYTPAKAPYRLTVMKDDYTITVRPCNALPNINLLPHKPLNRYLISLGITKKKAKMLSARIIDWRDRDDYLTPNGAEYRTYQRRDNPYTPKNGDITDWAELNYLLGSDAHLIELLREHFVLYGKRIRVQGDYITAETMSALTGLDQKTIALILRNQAEDAAHKKALENLLTTREAAAFNETITWVDGKEKDGPLLIELKRDNITLHATYDTTRRNLLQWYFSHSQPGEAPSPAEYKQLEAGL